MDSRLLPGGHPYVAERNCSALYARLWETGQYLSGTKSKIEIAATSNCQILFRTFPNYGFQITISNRFCP
eukprot:7031792-Lingulodinium_polyedra.AAC.1